VTREYLDARLTQLEARFDGRLAPRETKLDNRFAQLEFRLETRLSQIANRIIATQIVLSALLGVEIYFK
jgi:hypothetical protein